MATGWERDRRAQDGGFSTGSLLFDVKRQHDRTQAMARQDERQKGDGPRDPEVYATFHDKSH